MSIKTSHSVLGWKATDIKTGKTATASFDEGREEAVERLKRKAGEVEAKSIKSSKKVTSNGS